MKAIWNNTTIAEADKAELIYIEGNWYFPADSVKQEYLQPSDTHTTCFWKGDASYYHIVVGEQRNADAAWYYPEPKDGSIDQVKKDFTNYVAFWRGVDVAE
jgi:uncharacterized protein (DUF427 family)